MTLKKKKSITLFFLPSEQIANVETEDQLEEIVNIFETKEQLEESMNTFEENLNKVRADFFQVQLLFLF